jgi:hypothetical protein
MIFVHNSICARFLLVAHVAATISWTCSQSRLVHANDFSQAIATLRTIAPSDDGNRKAVPAVASLQQASGADLIPVLAAMKDATPVGRNYLAMVANSLYRKSGSALISQLDEFLQNTTNDGEARYMVLQWLTANDVTKRNDKLASMTDDPSLELRFAAIELALTRAEDISDKAAKATQLNSLFNSARQPTQVIAIAKKLSDLGQPVDMIRHFGFVNRWNLIGPFDNIGEAHFETVYPVESDLIGQKSDLSAEYSGKIGPTRWIQHTTDNQEGVVNLAELYNKEKGAIVYAFQTFQFETAKDIELRLGTINANKVWWNGELVTSNEVYHASMEIDQYIAIAKAKPGINRLVLKLCQNEQTQGWAQDWKFQIRICEADGTAVLPK